MTKHFDSRANSTAQAFLCRPGDPPRASKRDAKVVRRFAKFLAGKGTRCPACLHKAKAHTDGLLFTGRGAGCGKAECPCLFTRYHVTEWWAQKNQRSAHEG